MYPDNRFIQSYCHQGRIGVLIEIGLETWIVTQRDEFLAFSRDLAMYVAARNPPSVEAMLAEPFVKEPAIAIGAVLAEAANRFGETITITRFVRWDQDPPRPEPLSPRDPAVAVRQKRA